MQLKSFLAMNILIFTLFISFLRAVLSTEVISTQVSVQGRNNESGERRNISIILEKIKGFMKIMPIQLEETGNEICDEHLQMMKESLQNTEPWALQMIDASSKIIDGVLEGHMYNLGNFDNCISVKVPDNIFRGKYCLSLLSVGLNTSIYEILKYMDWHAFPTQYFKGDHMLNFGPQLAICLPSSCSAEDFKTAVNKYIRSKHINAVMLTDERLCSINEYEPLDVSDWIAIGILCFFVVVTIWSTLYDITTKHSEYRMEIFVSFSIYTNGKKLISNKCDTYLHNLHGIRFISSIWVMVAHVYMSVMYTSSNVIRGVQLIVGWDRFIISNSFLSVDTFLLLSGLLLCFSFLNSMENKNLRDFNIILFYFSRYIRLTPVLAVLVMLSATLIRHFGSGPMWNEAIYRATTPCRDYWWIPLLYIQNYVDYATCVMQSWYLAVDFQLYIVSPILLILIWKKPRIAIPVLIFLVIASMGIIFGIAFAYEEHLLYIEIARDVFGSEKIDSSSSWDAAFPRNRLLMKTHTRFSPWVIGILLGYILHKCKSKTIVLQKRSIVTGWILSAILMLFPFTFGQHLLTLDYEYNIWECSIYLAVHRVTWSVGVAWMIFACANGYGGIVNWFLSLPAWVPLSRLVYSTYLFHASILQLLRISTLDSLNVTAIDTITTLIAIFAVSTVVSAVASLMFESPFIALLNILLKGSSRKRVKTSLPKVEENACDS